MGKYFLLWLLCLCMLRVSSQDTAMMHTKTIVAAEIGSPGIGMAAEWMHGRIFTVETAAFVGPSYHIEDVFLTFILTPSFSRPAVRFSVTPRIYLNMQDRLKERKKKYTQVDTYLGFGYSYVTQSFDKTNSSMHLFTLHAGWRQFFSKRGIFNANAGIGYAVSPGAVAHTFYPAFNVKIGYRLN